jgi:hypothetical protein
MAGIDKTYTDSYSDYKEFKDWADKQILTFFNGHTVCIGDWIWDYEEEDFNYGEIPIMNTPTWLDIYLIQNCKTKFVLDRLKSVYGEDSFKEYQSVDLTAKPPINFQQNRKVSIEKSDRTKYPLHKKPYRSKKGKSEWWLQCNNNFGYHEETKTWSSYDNYYPHNTNTASIKSIKGIVRHLRKQYLPKGTTFNISGMYVGEDYLVVIS